MTTYAVVGKPVTREDGPDKVSGQYIYPADIVLPGMLLGKVVRSPFPHAKIVHIDISRALKLAGVRAVITGQDTAGMLVGRHYRDIPLLAAEKVRFVGEKVAAVAADDLETAEEALTLIDVEYEEIPAVFDPLEAMEPGAPLVHEGSPAYEIRPIQLSDESLGFVHPRGNIITEDTWSDGDLERGFRESDLIFEHTFTTPWVHQGYIETFTCVVDINDSGRIQVWANNKQPFPLKRQLARTLGLSADRIRINPCGIGGDFGGKVPAMDAPLCYLLSQRSGRPVKMIMNYVEDLMAGNPRHPSVITIKTGVKNDGQFWARQTRVVFNSGAYAGFKGNSNVRGGMQAGGGPYQIPNFRIDSMQVYTNNVPSGSFRAPGEPQAVFAVESHTDMIAREMGRDPYELRLQNVVHEGEISATGQLFQHVRAEETLRGVAEAANWGAPKRGPYFGRGIAIGQRPASGSTAAARLSLNEDAKATLYTPMPDTGVGAQTIARQVVAEELGIPAEDVGFTRMDTDSFHFDTGAGAAGSRVATRAAQGAAEEVRSKLTGLAAEFYGWPEERIVFQEGRVFVEGDPDKGVPLKELAAKAVAAEGGPIFGEMTHTADHAEVTSYCAQVAEVEVDPETGQVKVHRIVTAHDVGTILNPLGHQGQIDGAVIQGVGYAVMEGLEPQEGRIDTLSLGESKVPSMKDIPELVTVLMESPGGTGPYQAKGIGENPISPVTPAIANAIYDAVGVRIQDIPITAEKVLSKRPGGR